MKSGGSTLINGTQYAVSGGKTIINGTTYDIPFSNAPEYVLLASGTTSTSAIQGTATLPANTVAVIGEAHRYLSSGQDQTYGGLAPYYNGSWIRPYGTGFPITSRVDFSISGSTVTYNIPSLSATNGPYYVYAVVSKKATWHSKNTTSSGSAGATIYNPVPDNFICVIGNVSTLVESQGVWGSNSGAYSAYWFPPGLRSVMNTFRGEDELRVAASYLGYTGFDWTESAGIHLKGSKGETFVMSTLALYID